MSPVARLGLALLLSITALGATGCSRGGRGLRGPYPRGSECEQRACTNLSYLGVDRSDFLHREWCTDSRSKVSHDWWCAEPYCR